MKIAMIGLRGLGDGLGGVEKAVREIATRMANNGHEVTCYCKDRYSKDTAHENVKLLNIPTRTGKYLETLIYTIRAILHASRQNYDIIHIHALASSCLAWIPKYIYKRNVIITVHGLDWQRAKWGFFATQILKFGEWASVRFATTTLCVSKSLTMYYKMRYTDCNIQYIPNGCDHIDSKWAPVKGFKSKSYYLYLGRLVPEKGVHRLIEAYNEIDTEKTLVIAGPDSDPAYAEKLRQLACNNSNIIFTGPVYDEYKVRLLANAFMFVLPSDIEGLPIAALEAASYGVCTALSKIPTCDEIVDNKIIPCGFQFDPKSITELKTILNIADKADELVHKLGLRLRSQVRQNYNWDVIFRQSISAYEHSLKLIAC